MSIRRWKQIISGVLACASMVLHVGCAKYKAHSLGTLNTHHSAKESVEQTVSMAYQVFTMQECKKYLDRNVITKGYLPVHMTITNNSSHPMHFSPEFISFPVVFDEHLVAKSVHTSTAKRVMGYGLLSFFIWPLIIPAIVDGIGSSQANKELDRDFATKTLVQQVISPYDSINGLVFVQKEHFTSEFTVSLTDLAENKKLTLSPNHSLVYV